MHFTHTSLLLAHLYNIVQECAVLLLSFLKMLYKYLTVTKLLQRNILHKFNLDVDLNVLIKHKTVQSFKLMVKKPK